MSFMSSNAEMPDKCEPGEFGSAIARYLQETGLEGVTLRIFGVKITGKKKTNKQPNFNQPCGQVLWDPRAEDERHFHVGQFLAYAACNEKYSKILTDLGLGHYYYVQAEDNNHTRLTSTLVAVGQLDDDEDPAAAAAGAQRGNSQPSYQDRMGDLFERMVDQTFSGMEQRFATGMAPQAAGLPMTGHPGAVGASPVADMEQLVQVEPGVLMTQREVINRSKSREIERQRLLDEREELREQMDDKPDPQTEQMNNMMKAGMMMFMNRQSKKNGGDQDPAEKAAMLMAAGFSMDEIKELAQMQQMMAPQQPVGGTVSGQVAQGPTPMYNAMGGGGFMSAPTPAAVGGGAVPFDSPYASILDGARPTPTQPTVGGRHVDDDDHEEEEEEEDDDNFVDEEEEYMAELTDDLKPFSRQLFKHVHGAIQEAINAGNYAGVKEAAIEKGKGVFLPLLLGALADKMGEQEAHDYMEGVLLMEPQSVAEAIFQGLSVPQKMMLKSINLQDEARNIFASTLQQVRTERAQAPAQ